MDSIVKHKISGSKIHVTEMFKVSLMYKKILLLDEYF